MKKKTPKAKKPVVTLRFRSGSETAEGSGATILEALQNIKPQRFKGFVKLEAEVGGALKSIPIKIVPVKMERIFNLVWEQELFAKRLQTLL